MSHDIVTRCASYLCLCDDQHTIHTHADEPILSWLLLCHHKPLNRGGVTQIRCHSRRRLQTHQNQITINRLTGVVRLKYASTADAVYRHTKVKSPQATKTFKPPKDMTPPVWNRTIFGGVSALYTRIGNRSLLPHFNMSVRCQRGVSAVSAWC